MENAVKVVERSRVSWSAVLSGVLLSLVLWLALFVLIIAVAANTVSSLAQSDSLHGVEMGGAISAILATAISIAVGSFVAGRSSPAQAELHGVLSWAAVTLITGYMLLSLTGNVASAAMRVVGGAASAVGSGVSAALPAMGAAAQQNMGTDGMSVDWSGLQGEVDQILRQTGKPELQPERLHAKGKALSAEAEHSAQRAATDDESSSQALHDWLTRVKNRAAPVLSAADTDALANIIEARTGKSSRESNEIANKLARHYKDVMQSAQAMQQHLVAKARDAADAAMLFTSRAAWLCFSMIVLGALIGWFSGRMGERHRLARTESAVEQS